jgi:ankyrin repeat protein
VSAFAFGREKEPIPPSLLRAAEAGDAVSIETLLAAGANANETAADGMTSLMLAAANGHLRIVSRLIDRGADIDAARNDGVTALALAAYFGQHQIVRELIANGANSAAIGKFRGAVDLWARSRGYTVTRPSLVDAKEDQHQQDAAMGPGGDARDSNDMNVGYTLDERRLVEPRLVDRLSMPEPLQRKPVARPRLLDENAVLPSEASYATVALHKKIASRPPRVLNESVVLPGEASYATVTLYQESATDSHSSTAELFNKLFTWNRLGMPALMSVLVCAAAALLFFNFTTVRGFFNAIMTETDAKTSASSPKGSAAKNRVTSSSTVKLPESQVPQQKEAESQSPGVTDAGVQETVVANTAATQPLPSEGTTKRKSTFARRIQPRVTETTDPKKASAGESSASESAQKGATPRVNPPVTATTADAAKSEVPAAPKTGGAERPRRVETKPEDSQPASVVNPPKRPKTKVIPWP